MTTANPNTDWRTGRFVRNVALKTVFLFVAANLAFIALRPLAGWNQPSLYNLLVPGRLRLPFGENPDQSYNLSLQNLPAMLASHALHGTPKAADEYRVILIGDSAVWGVLLSNTETLSAQITAAALTTADGRRVRAYNLGYPVQSLLKDLLILSAVRRYDPDLIVWLFTPEAFAPDQQLATRLVQENPDLVESLIRQFSLPIRTDDPKFIRPTLWEQTIIGQRRALADWLRLQLYGLAWGVTEHDQTYPRFYLPRMEDFGEDVDWHGFTPETLPESAMADTLAFEMLAAGSALMGNVPILFVNEPMFRSEGINSTLRYNFFYPRWVVDRFRAVMAAESQARLWLYLDLWNAVPSAQFTDSAVHLTPEGVRMAAVRVGIAILEAANPTLLQYPHWLDGNQPSDKKDGRRSFSLDHHRLPIGKHIVISGTVNH